MPCSVRVGEAPTGGLPRSPVPARSVSDELRRYPNDLLTAPLDVRDVTLRPVPGGRPSS